MALRVPAELQARLLDVLALDTERIMIDRAIGDARVTMTALDSDAEYLDLVRDAEEAAELLDDVNREVAHVESDIRVARDRIERDRARETTSSDSKELSSLEHEIASLERRIEMLEENELELLARRDEAVASRNDLATRRDRFHGERDDTATSLAADIAAHVRRIGDIEESRAAILAELPAEFAALYEKQRERYGVGASFLQRGITSASGVTLTTGQLQEIRSADPDDVILCPDSNAILIRTAESGL